MDPEQRRARYRHGRGRLMRQTNIGRTVMKTSVLIVASGILAATGAISSASAQTAEQKMFTPPEIKWSPGPASLPAGAEIAVLYGDASKEELFAMRIKVPKGYRIAPHSHPKPEIGRAHV